VAGQLAKQAWATPDPKQEVHWRENVERLSAEKERLEAELSDRSAAYRQAKKQVTLEELQQALPKEAVLVDILQYNHCTPPDKTAGTKTSWQQRLVAFVVRHDGPVARVNLGPMGPVSEAIDTWRTTFGMSPQGAAAGRWLRQKLWEPVEAQLGGAKIVLVSPDGALSRLPLGALPGKEPGKYLIEDYTLAIVPTAQVIPEIVQEQGRKELRKHLLLLGNIDYDAQPGKSAPAPTSPMQPTRALPRGFSHFDRLPGTADEVAAITRLYQSDFGRDGITTLAQREASKRSFLAEAGLHRYLHLATHGFFVEEKLPTPALLGQRGSERFGEMLHGPQTAEVHAGLLSGLALAGANRAGRAEARDVLAENDSDDGILTAEELGTQNLDGVQLVVLSACETGLGKAAAGEGLLGLQRAFQSAGARTVVASLWSVPDNETRMLMEAFYTNLWTRKQGALDSLRQAQLAMLHGGGKAGQLRGAERDIEDDHSGHARFSPRYWAAFVLSGDWR
jgi:CHAT domain-containing protein